MIHISFISPSLGGLEEITWDLWTRLETLGSIVLLLLWGNISLELTTKRFCKKILLTFFRHFCTHLSLLERTLCLCLWCQVFAFSNTALLAPIFDTDGMLNVWLICRVYLRSVFIVFCDALCRSGVSSLWLVMPCVCLECVHCGWWCLVSVWSVFTMLGDALCRSGVCSLWLVMPCVWLECVHCGW